MRYKYRYRVHKKYRYSLRAHIEIQVQVPVFKIAIGVRLELTNDTYKGTGLIRARGAGLLLIGSTGAGNDIQYSILFIMNVGSGRLKQPLLLHHFSFLFSRVCLVRWRVVFKFRLKYFAREFWVRVLLIMLNKF